MQDHHEMEDGWKMKYETGIKIRKDKRSRVKRKRMIEGGIIEFTSAKILDSFTYLLQLSYNRTKFTKLNRVRDQR